MTRYPKTCDKSDPEGKAHGPCELKPGHEGLCVAFGQTFDAAPARDTSGDVGPADHLDGLVAYATPAPHDAPLDFEKKCPNPHCENGMIRDTVVGCATCHGGLDIARSLQAANEAMRSIGERCAGPKWEHARDTELQRQARAFVDAAVKAAVAENDRMWGLSIIPLGADHIHAVTTRFIALREARDDHR